MVAVAEKNTLKRFGISVDVSHFKHLPPEKRCQVFRQNLEAYTNEVLADEPVSVLYHYWFNNQGNLFTDHSCEDIYNLRNQFDPRERNNFPAIGFEQVKKQLVDNKNKVVLWYSPPGPASLDNNSDNPYSSITYNYGQLYIQYYDGEKINAVAIKIDNENVLTQLSPTLFTLSQTKDEKEKITQSLLHPVVFPGNIDDFINSYWINELIYKQYDLYNVIKDIANAFSATRKMPIMTFDQTIDQLIKYEATSEMILKAYLSTIYRYQRLMGQEQINLSGSCGGSSISSAEIEELLGMDSGLVVINPIKQLLSIYSSFYRTITQGGQRWEYNKGDCVSPGCGEKNVDVGPCGICKKCETKLNSSKNTN